jgi:hypothetical protein
MRKPPTILRFSYRLEIAERKKQQGDPGMFGAALPKNGQRVYFTSNIFFTDVKSPATRR